MKKIKLTLIILFFLLVAGFTNTTNAQTVYHPSVIDVRLTGTSTLHDWEMKTNQAAGEAAFFLDNEKLTSLARLNFTIPVKNLKSGNSKMDDNTYKALNTAQHTNILFQLTSATVKHLAGNDYQLICQGKLTIAGSTRHTELVANGRFNSADKSLTVTGVKKMKMTDFNVKPPTVMLGTIKTGDNISINYNIKFIK